MRYSKEQLLQFNRENLKPVRAARKAIFRYGLWLPAAARRRRTLVCPQINQVTCDLVLPPDEHAAYEDLRHPTSRSSFRSRDSGPEPKSNVNNKHDHLVSFGLLNARSVGNKYTAICSEIVERRLKICLLTETWHTSCTDTAIRRCVPSGFSLHDRPRPSDGTGQNHGGLAVVLSDDMHLREIKSAVQPTTFESMFFAVTHGTSTTIVLLIYRPGSVSQIPPEF